MRRDEKGQALVEFAVLVPLLTLLVFGIIEFGISLYNYQQESNAVGVAARLLASSRGQTSDPCAMVASAMVGTSGAAPGLTAANLALTVTLNGTAYNGTGNSFSCTAGAANLVYASSAQVKAVYPCNLTLVNISSCSLTSQTTEVVQ